MRYRYYTFYKDPMFSGMAAEDSGICYSRDELDATIGYAMQDDDCFYFAWERLDRLGEPAGDLHVEKDVGVYRQYQGALKGGAMKRKGFWQEVERDGLDYDWYFDGDRWIRHYPFGEAIVVDKDDIGCGWCYQLFDYDGKCAEHIKYISLGAAQDAADIEAEELGLLGDGGLMMGKKAYARRKNAQWYLEDAFYEPDDSGLNAPVSFFDQRADGWHRGGGWWQSRVFSNGWEAEVFDDNSWQVVDGDKVLMSSLPYTHYGVDSYNADGVDFYDAVAKAEAWVRENAGISARRKARGMTGRARGKRAMRNRRRMGI